MGRFSEAYVLHIIWIVALLFCGFILSPELIGWVLIGVVAFLIYPRFWERREEAGKRGFQGGRTVIAVMFSLVIAYSAWTRANETGPFGQSDVKAVVASGLHDPASAEFRNILEGSDATCGEVNGKNAFGAYAGFKPFVYDFGAVLFEPEQPVVSDVQQQTAYLEAVAEFRQAQQRCYK